jgi:ABC-2 type transport system permease protein
MASWSSLASPALWVGVAAGVAMIAAAVWLRRWREEG